MIDYITPIQKGLYYFTNNAKRFEFKNALNITALSYACGELSL